MKDTYIVAPSIDFISFGGQEDDDLHDSAWDAYKELKCLRDAGIEKHKIFRIRIEEIDESEFKGGEL